MYRYEYVPLSLGGGFFINNESAEHRGIIEQRAAQGWRYVGYMPTRFTSYGGVKEIDMIFEKPEEAR